jgi:hypothetical protein
MGEETKKRKREKMSDEGQKILLVFIIDYPFLSLKNG